MSGIYLRKTYTTVCCQPDDPGTFINDLVEKALEKAPEGIPKIPKEKES